MEKKRILLKKNLKSSETNMTSDTNTNMDWYLYELYCIQQHKIKYPNQEIWHWHNVPEEILIKCGVS